MFMSVSFLYVCGCMCVCLYLCVFVYVYVRYTCRSNGQCQSKTDNPSRPIYANNGN